MSNNDIHTAYTEAETVARRLSRVEDDADTLVDDMAALVAELADFEADMSRDTRDLLNAVKGRICDLAADLREVSGDAGDLEMTLDDLQHDAAERADFAEMVLDVERGIRDPGELNALVRSMTSSYVL